MIAFKKASPKDASELTAVQIRSFDDNSRQHGRGEHGGPPGYDSASGQVKIMEQGDYYKILDGRRIIGGIIIFQIDAGHYELWRIYIAPEYQNQGIGAQALQFIEQTYPQVRRWTLDTPNWAKRNQHFYEKHGYIRVGEQALADFDFSLILYQKLMVSSSISND